MAKAKNALMTTLSNTKSRTFLILFGAVVLVGVGLLVFSRSDDQEDILAKQASQAVGVPASIKSTPGGVVSDQYRDLLEKENERRAQEALKAKTSAIPTIIRAVSESEDQQRFTLRQADTAQDQSLSDEARAQFGLPTEGDFLGTTGPFTKSALERQREEQENRIREQRERVQKMRADQDRARLRAEQEERQRAVMAQEQKEYQDAVLKINQKMLAYTQSAHQEWSKIPFQSYQIGQLGDEPLCSNCQLVKPEETVKVTTKTLYSSNLSAADRIRENEPQVVRKRVREVIKAGTILFGILDTAINTDEPGPVLATIISSKYQGSKLLGELRHEARQEKVTITFNQMSIPKGLSSMSVQVVAIDPDTARTALASDVSRHYLLRYGALFASSFIEGYGDAIQNSGATTVTSPLTGATTTSTPVLDNQEKFLSALGEVGAAWAEQAKKTFDIPYTVRVDQGTSIGLLFLTDAPVPEDAISNR